MLLNLNDYYRLLERIHPSRLYNVTIIKRGAKKMRCSTILDGKTEVV